MRTLSSPPSHRRRLLLSSLLLPLSLVKLAAERRILTSLSSSSSSRASDSLPPVARVLFDSGGGGASSSSNASSSTTPFAAVVVREELRTCPSRRVRATAPEFSVIRIGPGVVGQMRTASFGVTAAVGDDDGDDDRRKEEEGERTDCLGVLESYVESDGSLRFPVSSERMPCVDLCSNLRKRGKLGPDAKCSLEVEFDCGKREEEEDDDDAGADERRRIFGSTERERLFVERTMKDWEEEAERTSSSSRGDGGDDDDDGYDPCAYERETPAPFVPYACLEPAPAGDGAGARRDKERRRRRCLRHFYDAAMTLADRDPGGALPVNYVHAIRCDLRKVIGGGGGGGGGGARANSSARPPLKLSALVDFARRNKYVWLVRISKDRKITWEVGTERRAREAVWRWPESPWGNVQLCIRVIEKALDEHPDLLRDVAHPVYLLINGSDLPVVSPPPDHVPPPATGGTYLRPSHQADNVPSVEFMANYTRRCYKPGWCGPVDPGETPDPIPPVLSWSVIPGWHRDVVAPNRHPGFCSPQYFDPALGALPFERRRDAVSYRAYEAYCRRDKMNSPKARLTCFGRDHDGSLVLGTDLGGDAGVGGGSNGTRVLLDVEGGSGIEGREVSRYLSPARQSRSKYLVLLDGLVASFRSTWYFKSGCAVLATGVWKDVRTRLLRPWVHYVPFSTDFGDFETALDVLASNGTYAKWVGDNARRAGLLLAGPDADGGEAFDVRYYAALLREYARVVRVEEDGGELTPPLRWSDDRQCGAWRNMEKRIRQCLPDEWVCGNATG